MTQDAGDARRLRWAAQAGDLDAAYDLGMLVKDEDPEEAERWLRRAAEAGDAHAAYNLGVLLEQRDPEQAKRWWREAAGGTDPGVAAVSALNLGLALRDTQQPDEAARWLELAARAGDPTCSPKAAYNLGVLLTDRDPGKAVAWLRQAAADDGPNVAIALRAAQRLSLLLKDYDAGDAEHWLQVAGRRAVAAVSQAVAAGDLGWAAENFLVHGETLVLHGRGSDAADALASAAALFQRAGDMHGELRARGRLVAVDPAAAQAEFVRMAELSAQHAREAGDAEAEAAASMVLARLLAEQGGDHDG